MGLREAIATSCGAGRSIVSVLSRDGRAAEIRRSGLERDSHRVAAFAEDAELRGDDFRREPLWSGGPDLHDYADPPAGAGIRVWDKAATIQFKKPGRRLCGRGS